VTPVLLRAVILPCHHNVRPYVMVTRCQLQAEGLLLSFQQKQRKKLNKIDLKDLNTSLGEIRSRIGSSLEEEKEMIESQRPFGWPSKFLCVWVWVGV